MLKKDIIVIVYLDKNYKKYINDDRTIIVQGRGDGQYHLFSVHRSKFSGLDSLERNRYYGDLVLFHNESEIRTSENV